jgi:class 3 adenylate cyclase/tetratricopeptide (TPR) repeat protein
LETLLPYVPRIAVEWDIQAPGRSWQTIDATFCFVDISGFTALSERLARRGRIGAEELTEVLDHVFARMLAVAYEKGGSLLKFGGDALLIGFAESDHAVLAAQAAVGMRAALREARLLQTSVGRVNLRMSVGLHSGVFHLFRVGASHKELLVAGPAATLTTRMEQTAGAGEIVVSEATAARLPAGAVGNPKDDGRLLRWRKPIEGGPGVPSVHPSDPTVVTESVPVRLRQQLLHGASEAEHRIASVGFVKFQGVDDLIAARGEDETAAALDEIVTAVQAAVDDEDVTFLASDLDANGGKIILVAGVPTARDDDEGRLLRSARRILDQSFALPVKIGTNRGHVFAANVGAEFRRTYTVMGDTVNLAARLMAAAHPGELYATAPLLEQSHTLFATRALEPFLVKGKSQPVYAYAVGDAEGTRATVASSLPFVGRAPELAWLRASHDAAMQGRGRVLVIEGDRGIGKTRLLHEHLADCREPVLLVEGEPFATSIPYAALRGPLRDVLGLDESDRWKAGLQLAEAVQTASPRSADLAPLLAPVLDVELSPTPASQVVAPQFWRDTVGALIVELLQSVAPAMVIAVDDAQWIDDASADILDRVFTSARDHAWCCVSARRPLLAGFLPAAVDETRVLAPIDDTTVSDVIETVMAAAPLRPQERDELVARAAGNPLFLDELLRVTRTSGPDALPDTLDAVVTREIDELSPVARRVVRYASVLGQSFTPRLLANLIGVDAIDDDMSRAVQTCLVRVRDADRMRFRHALLQEVAYERLPFRKRVELHRRAGDAILLDPPDDSATAEALLSLHFFRGQEWDRAWKHARIAGRDAADAFAPMEAATHLERAVAAARHLPDVAPNDVAEVLVSLGEALETVGVYVKADDAYRRAAAAIPDDPLSRAQIAERRSHLAGEIQGRPVAAIRHVRAGIALLDAMPESSFDNERVRARLLAREADLRSRQGQIKEAMRLCEMVINEAAPLGEQRALAVALTVLDCCLVDLNRSNEATNMAKALELYEALDDRMYVAITLGNLAGLAHHRADWIRAAGYYDRAVDAALSAGDLAGVAIAQANLGELRVDQGRLEEAEELLAKAVRTLASFEYVGPSATTMLHLARTRAFLGDASEAHGVLDAATQTLDLAHVRIGSLEARARRAEICLFTGDIECAAEALAEARELERTLGETQFMCLLDRLEITLAALSHDISSARALIDVAVPRAREAGAKFELLFLLTLAQRFEVDDAERERAELATELGVVRIAALPLFDA